MLSTIAGFPFQTEAKVSQGFLQDLAEQLRLSL